MPAASGIRVPRQDLALPVLPGRWDWTCCRCPLSPSNTGKVQPGTRCPRGMHRACPPTEATPKRQTGTLFIIKNTFVIFFPRPTKEGKLAAERGVSEVSPVLAFAVGLCARSLPLPPERIIMGSGFLNPLSFFDSFNIYL